MRTKIKELKLHENQEVLMKNKMLLTLIALIGFAAFVGNTQAQAPAQAAAPQPDAKILNEARKRSDSASKVVIQIMSDSDRSIPRELLQKASAVVVFPGVLKGAFVVGGQGGKGVVVRRTKDGWSAPAFLKMAGGSIGAQIGGSKIDYIMVIMNDGGLKGLLEDKFEIGGEASVSAGPVGRNAAASTNATFDAQILTYSRSKGAFIGVSLKGAVITQDEDLNRGIYGKSAKALLIDNETPSSEAPEDLQGFPKIVDRFAK